MSRIGLLCVMLVAILGAGCGGGDTAVTPKSFAPPPTDEPSLPGGKGATKPPDAVD